MLHFDLERSDLERVAETIGATDKQVKFAMSRAMRRTEATLRKMSSKGLPNLLGLRTAAVLRKRLKSIKIRAAANEAGMALWYGLNDLPISSFKGRPKNTSSGASFRDKEFDGAFVGKSKAKSKNTIFKRKGSERLPIVEQLYPIEDKAIVFIEDDVFDKALDIFWQHFERDLRARVKFKLGES